MTTERIDALAMHEARGKAFRRATKGVPAYKVANALNSLTPGINWRSSTKADMCEAFAKGVSYTFIGSVPIERLNSAVAKVCPRIPQPRIIELSDRLRERARRADKESGGNVNAGFLLHIAKELDGLACVVSADMAELIEADKEYDDARSALANYKPKPNFDAAFASAADYEPERKLEARVKTATERRRAALARIGGAA